MKIFEIEVIVIIAICLIAVTISTNLEIIRIRPNEIDGWTKGTDIFKIPLSLCGQDRSDTVNCARFNAEVIAGQNGDQCICSCPNENATLMFENDEWSCRNHAYVRKVLGK